MEFTSHGLFRRFDAENRRLSDYLKSQYGQEAHKLVASLSIAQLNQPDHDLIDDIIRSIRPADRLLLSPPSAGRKEEGTPRPDDYPGYRVSTVRQFVYFQVSGDREMLSFWPDEAPDTVQPLESESEADEPSRDPQTYDGTMEREKHERRSNSSRWRLALSEFDTIVLCTYFELSEDEQDLVGEGKLDLRRKGLELYSYAAAVTEAIQEQADFYFEQQLPATVQQFLDTKRRRVRNSEAMARSLSWPEEWRQQDIFLEGQRVRPISSPARQHHHARANDIAELQVAHRNRLSSASFETVLQTIRTWTDAVERTPLAFSSLHEDRLSDILCATLNATLPGANREVYTRTGKADIVVRAGILEEGRGPAAVYVCESKWWSSSSKANAALDQLFGYLTEADLVGTLIFFIATRESRKPRSLILETLQDRADFGGLEQEIVRGWPVLSFIKDGTKQTICVAFVHIPPR